MVCTVHFICPFTWGKHQEKVFLYKNCFLDYASTGGVTFSSDLVGRPVILWSCGDNIPLYSLWGTWGSSRWSPKAALGAGPLTLWNCWPISLEYGRKRFWAQLLGVTAAPAPTCSPPSAWVLEVAFIHLTIIWPQLFVGHWDESCIFKYLMMTAELLITNMIESSQATHFRGIMLKRVRVADACSSSRGNEATVEREDISDPGTAGRRIPVSGLCSLHVKACS